MFNSVEFNGSSSDEGEQIIELNMFRRKLRDMSNPLDLPAHIFIKNFRVSKEVFRYLLIELNIPAGLRATYISPILQLALTLNILGGGSYQRQAGADWSVPLGQSTVSRISTAVINKMQQVLCPQWIKFTPSSRTKEHFLQKFGIPGVVGVIDGSHVMILRPKDNEYMFYNRKGRHSINVMIICDENRKILAVNAKYGGCAHDSFIWRQSSEREEMERQWFANKANSWLLGDSGYPLEPFLITPYRAVRENSPEAKFNEIHSKARSIVERCIGVLKMRWRIILEERTCRYAPSKVAKIVNVCSALHNLCSDYNVPEPDVAHCNNHFEQRVLSQNSDTREAESIRNRIRDLIND